MHARSIHAAAPGGKTLKGQKPQGRRCLEQRLGAWAASEEEPKPTRGSPGFMTVPRGGLESEDPVAQPVEVKGMRGVPKQ